MSKESSVYEMGYESALDGIKEKPWINPPQEIYPIEWDEELKKWFNSGYAYGLKYNLKNEEDI